MFGAAPWASRPKEQGDHFQVQILWPTANSVPDKKFHGEKKCPPGRKIPCRAAVQVVNSMRAPGSAQRTQPYAHYREARGRKLFPMAVPCALRFYEKTLRRPEIAAPSKCRGKHQIATSGKLRGPGNVLGKQPYAPRRQISNLFAEHADTRLFVCLAPRRRHPDLRSRATVSIQEHRPFGA